MNSINSIFKTFVLSVLVSAQVHFAYAQTASILPPAKTTFVDANGKPLTSGTVDFYIPSTTTRKTTWQDTAETVPNANPVVLDAAGRALILGSGSYRQVVKDRNGNTIWDQVTSSTGAGSGGGSTATGDGDLVGTIKPWAGLAAPNQYVFAYGQELSRTTYATLFTAITSSQGVFCTSGSPILTGVGDTTNLPIGSSLEVSCIAAGFTTIVSKTSSSVTMAANANVNTNPTAVFFPWGNGDHSTTFNVPDLRGFTIAGNNNMGGVASANLTTTYFGATNPNSIGAAGGGQSYTLVTANLPPYTPAGTNGSIAVNSSVNNVLTGTVSTSTFNYGTGGGAILGAITSGTLGGGTLSSSGTAPTFTGSAQGGVSAPVATVPPTKTANYIIKVTPDVNSATASGVTSLGAMTGSIACGAGITCTGNIISSTGGSAIAYSVLSNSTGSLATAAYNSTPQMLGIKVIPTASGFSQPFLSQTALTGSAGLPTGSTPNLFYISSDDYALGGAAFVNGMSVSHVFGGAAATGGRQAFASFLELRSATNAANANRNYAAAELVGFATASDGGTNTGAGAKGAMFGSSSWGDLQSGATNFLDVTASELNVSIRTGASAKYKTIMNLSEHNLDAVSGASVDAALSITAQTGAIGLNHGIIFTDMSGIGPTKAAGTLIGSSNPNSTSLAAAHGVDLSGYTFSTDAFKSTGFSVSPTGAIAGIKLTTVNSVTSGLGAINATVTQTAPNAGDTSDGGLSLSHILLAASATNELIVRAALLGSTNTLTGGGVVANQRLLDMFPVVSAGATTTALANIYMEGTNAGTVTTGYGIYINNILGTTKWAVYNIDTGANEFNAGALGVGTSSVGAAGSITATAGFFSATANKTLVLKQGANGSVGTFVCTSGGTISISNSNVAITDAIIISLNTVGGTISTNPTVNAITAATSFTAKCATSDTSTYNYALIKNAA